MMEQKYNLENCEKCNGEMKELNRQEIQDKLISNVDGEIKMKECISCKNVSEFYHPSMNKK